MFRSVRDSNSTSAPFDGILLHLVFTDTFTDFIASMRRTPSTIVFMVDNKGRMAGSSEPSLTIKVSNNTATQIPASESSNPVIKEVSNLFGDLLSKSSSGTSSGTHKSVAMDSSSQTLSLNLKVNVRLNGKTWDVQAKTMNQIPNSLANSYVASASPEEELYGASARIPQETTVISAAVIVLFALVSMLLTVPLLQSLQSVVNQMKKLENLDFSDFERGQFKNSSPITEIRAIQETLTAVTKTFAIALQNNRYLFKSSVVKSYCQIENEEIKQV
ncbi:hypothetical protein HK102_001687 [Quaeritorhiza haematococci]|nr:hypothetical protein HK102_001687 [Quaeritorhiza haematococci]